MRRLLAAIVGILMVIVVVAMLFLSPGLRHTHEGGDEHHSHQSTHSHAHSHSHSHGRSHTHGRHSHGHFHGNDAEAAVVQTHVHISFLWFEFTLPDFSGGKEQSVASVSESAGEKSATADSSTVLAITSPFTMSRLIQLVFLIPALLLERVKTPISDLVACFHPASPLQAGRLPDAPPLPPPRFM